MFVASQGGILQVTRDAQKYFVLSKIVLAFYFCWCSFSWFQSVTVFQKTKVITSDGFLLNPKHQSSAWPV
jgi:hypothetical protein